MTLGALVHAGADPVEVADDRRPARTSTATRSRFEPVLRCGIAATHALVVVDDSATSTSREHATSARPTSTVTTTRTHAHEHDRRDRTTALGRTARSASCSMPPTCRRGSATGRSARSACSPRSRGRCTASTPTTSSSTRSARSTRSSTSSARARRSRCLGIDRIVCSPITVGQGTSTPRTASCPTRRPRCVDLLALRGAPSRGIADHRELATPTGVALMVALADEFGPMPAMHVASVGYGAGTRDIPGRPNVVQVVIGDGRLDATPGPGQPVQLLECNVDDVDRRGARAHDRRAARRRRARRVGHADRDEEGPPGAHRARAVRPRASSTRPRA